MQYPLRALAGLLFCLSIWLVPALAAAQFSDPDLDYTLTETAVQGDGVLQNFTVSAPLTQPVTYTLSEAGSGVADDFPYSGMSVYLGMAPAVTVSNTGRARVVKFKDGVAKTPIGDWAGYKGRFDAVMVRSQTGTIDLGPDRLTVSWPAGARPDLMILRGKPDSAVPPGNDTVMDIRRLQYAHLPRWMRALCRGVEGLYKGIASVTGLGWVLSLVLFAVVIKVLLLPISWITARFQNQANAHKAALEPIFEEIKQNHKGETAHNKVMAAYKARGITPYYSLKPLLATMISLPVLIAIFNMLGEIDPLRGASALWIDDLAYPDALATLPMRVPAFGSAFNLLPFLMAGVTCVSAFMLKSETASAREISRQKRNLYLMAAVFFVIFYPFPAVMVLYWTLATLLQPVANFVMKSR